MIRVFIFAMFMAFAFMVTGCATTKAEYVSAEVPQPPTITRPALPVAELRKGDTADIVLRAHRESILILQEYAQTLEAYLQAYRR